MRKGRSGGSGWLTAMAALLAAGLASCAGKQTPRDRISDPGELLYNGFAAADVECYKCHNADGRGTWRGANLVESVPNLTDQAIANAIHEGPGMMPAYKNKLDAQQVAALTAWLRGRFR
jgi:mono/diheme cytochrome c family protein